MSQRSSQGGTPMVKSSMLPHSKARGRGERSRGKAWAAAPVIAASFPLLATLPACGSRPLELGNDTTGQRIVGGNCGLAQAAFCDTFDQPMGIGNRSGQL